MPLLVIWALFGMGAAIVASNRGANGCLWFGLGVVLGPIGFLLAFTAGKKCPKCASKISEAAEVCPKCHHRQAGLGGDQKPIVVLRESFEKCAECGAMNDRTVFEACPHCGNAMSARR